MNIKTCKYVVLGLVFLHLTKVSVFAQQCNYVLSGRVLDAETMEPISFANIFIKEQGLGDVSDENGFYNIKGICEGEYTISCTHISCDHLEYDILINADTQKDFHLVHGPIALQNITVAEKAVELKKTQSEQSLSQEELANTQGLGLANALSKLAGVNTLNTGTSISKPIIQGLHSNRIVILNNGVRQEGQQWGAEHAPEIDPFIAESLTVVKGANSVRYGSEALGGVVLVEPKALSFEPGLKGTLNLGGYSNGRMGIASGMMETRLHKKIPLSGRLQGTIKRGGNIHAPRYTLANTGVQEYNFSTSLGLDLDKMDAEIFYSQFNTQLGIFRGSHFGNLTDLMNAYQSETPFVQADFTYELERPLQKIEHELFKAKATLQTGEVGVLNMMFTRQFNRRKEFDAHRQFGQLEDELDDPQQQFEITTHTADVAWEHKPVFKLNGSTGIQIIRQFNTTDRGGLIPNFKSWSGGLFWIEHWKNYPFPFEFEAGIRGDYKWLSVEKNQNTEATVLEFKNLSGTLGAIYKINPGMTLKYHFGTAWRAPNVNELFSDGVHHGAASYEKGNPNLQTEKAINNSLSFEIQKKQFQATANLYYNRIQNYIYLMPRPEGKLTIRGAFPAFDYQQADARLAGLDVSFSWAFAKWLSWNSKFSLLRARNVETEDYLALMPADNFENSLRFVLDREKASNYFQVAMINVLEQTRVPDGGDLIPPPEGYTRFDFEAGTTFNWSNNPVEVGLGIHNLFNVSYRDYLNRFRYFTDEIGRNISLRVRLKFGDSRN